MKRYSLILLILLLLVLAILALAYIRIHSLEKILRDSQISAVLTEQEERIKSQEQTTYFLDKFREAAEKLKKIIPTKQKNLPSSQPSLIEI